MSACGQRDIRAAVISTKSSRPDNNQQITDRVKSGGGGLDSGLSDVQALNPGAA